MARTHLVTLGAGTARTERTVEVEPMPAPADGTGGPARFRVTTGERARVFEVFRHQGGVLTLRDPETDRLAVVELDGAYPAYTVTAGDWSFPAKVESARRHSLLGVARRDAAGGPSSVTAPMPGRVVKVLVATGAQVKAGQGVAIVEAMKMENEVRASRDGTVTEVRAREGQAVEAQETLVVLT